MTTIANEQKPVWCWICRWVRFTAKPPRLRICTSCWRDPLHGLLMRRRRGEDPELDAEEDGVEVNHGR
jgi:hypothetical protein